jgi:hypothetical protein
MEIGIHLMTFNRWIVSNIEYVDKRTFCGSPEPANILTMERILEVVNTEEFSSLSICQKYRYLQTEGYI